MASAGALFNSWSRREDSAKYDGAAAAVAGRHQLHARAGGAAEVARELCRREQCQDGAGGAGKESALSAPLEAPAGPCLLPAPPRQRLQSPCVRPGAELAHKTLISTSTPERTEGPIFFFAINPVLCASG